MSKNPKIPDTWGMPDDQANREKSEYIAGVWLDRDRKNPNVTLF
jgi:hypothetical protein